MTGRQKRAAAFISLLLIALTSIFLIWIAALVIWSEDPLGGQFPGRFFMLLIHSENHLQTALEAVPFLVTFGISLLANYKMRDWIFYSIVAVTVAGISAATYLMIELSAIDTAKRFWQFSPVAGLEDYRSFVSAMRSSLVPFIAWFIGLLLSQLGIKFGQGGEGDA